MTVLIKGMEMPKACFKCRLLDSYFWQCEITKKTASHSADCVPLYCPLVPVPPHGDLIDIDETLNRLPEHYSKEDLEDVIGTSPTVIEAEGE